MANDLMGSVIDDSDLKLMGAVDPLYDKLGSVLAPLDKLKPYEELAATYFNVAAKFAIKGWQFLLVIEQEGLWKLINQWC